MVVRLIQLQLHRMPRAPRRTCEKYKLRKVQIQALVSNLKSLQLTSLKSQSILTKILRQPGSVKLVKSNGLIPDLRPTLTSILNSK